MLEEYSKFWWEHPKKQQYEMHTLKGNCGYYTVKLWQLGKDSYSSTVTPMIVHFSVPKIILGS